MSTVLEATVAGRAGAPAGKDSGTTARLVDRVRAEFVEMPGLKLTLSQSARIFGLDASQAKRVLKSLLDEGFLVCDSRGAFRRRLAGPG